MKKLIYAGVLLSILSAVASAELASIDDMALSDISGQGGVYLSGEISINENGGPIQNAYFGNCSDGARTCGARLAYQTKQNGGWFVLDDIRGSLSFQGLTLRVRHIDSGFGGDGASFQRDVLEIGLPNVIKVDDLNFTYATSNMARPTDETGSIRSDFRQTNIYSVQIDGDVTMQGNLLVFPTGNP